MWDQFLSHKILCFPDIKGTEVKCREMDLFSFEIETTLVIEQCLHHFKYFEMM
jgi:hypothetical protein